MEATIHAIHNTPEAAGMRTKFAMDFRARLKECIAKEGGQVDLEKAKKMKDLSNREGLPPLGRPRNVSRQLGLNE